MLHKSNAKTLGVFLYVYYFINCLQNPYIYMKMLVKVFRVFLVYIIGPMPPYIIIIYKKGEKGIIVMEFTMIYYFG